MLGRFAARGGRPGRVGGLSALPAAAATLARDRGPAAATKGGDPVRTGSFYSGFGPVFAVTALEKFEVGHARMTTVTIASASA
jgi:hypothetical protein